MLKAIIFDFNGVILNDEPLHFAAMRDAVADLGIRLTPEDYWNKYLPFDDRECLETVCRDHSFQLNETTRRESLERKARNYQQLLQGGFPLFPGVTQFIQTAAGRYPLALASGARRSEIESALNSTGLKAILRLLWLQRTLFWETQSGKLSAGTGMAECSPECPAYPPRRVPGHRGFCRRSSRSARRRNGLHGGHQQLSPRSFTGGKPGGGFPGRYFAG